LDLLILDTTVLVLGVLNVLNVLTNLSALYLDILNKLNSSFLVPDDVLIDVLAPIPLLNTAPTDNEPVSIGDITSIDNKSFYTLYIYLTILKVIVR